MLETKAKPINDAMRDAFPVPAPGFHIMADGHVTNNFHLAWRIRQIVKMFWSFQKVMNLAFYLLCFSAVGWLAAQYIDERAPVVVKHELLTPQVTPNSELRIKFDVERYRVCKLSLSWIIFDGINEVRMFEDQKPYPAIGDPGVVPSYVRGFWIPGYIAPGYSKIRIIRTYKCPNNYVHDFTMTEPDIVFMTLNKDGTVPDMAQKATTAQ